MVGNLAVQQELINRITYTVSRAQASFPSMDGSGANEGVNFMDVGDFFIVRFSWVQEKLSATFHYYTAVSGYISCVLS